MKYTHRSETMWILALALANTSKMMHDNGAHGGASSLSVFMAIFCWVCATLSFAISFERKSKKIA